MEKKHQYRGLTKQEVEESRRLHGRSMYLPCPRKLRCGAQFLEKFEDPIISYIISGMALVHDYCRCILLGA